MTFIKEKISQKLKLFEMWLHVEKISKCPSVMTIIDWKNFENKF